MMTALGYIYKKRLEKPQNKLNHHSQWQKILTVNILLCQLICRVDPKARTKQHILEKITHNSPIGASSQQYSLTVLRSLQ